MPDVLLVLKFIFNSTTETIILGTTGPTAVSTEGETEMATGLAISKEKLNFRQIQLSEEEQQVVDQLTGIGTCVSTGETAARTSWVLDQMVKNYYSGTNQ